MADFSQGVVLTPEFQGGINEARRIKAANQLGQLQANYGLVQSRMQNQTAQEAAASQRAVLAHDLQLRRESAEKYDLYDKRNDSYQALRAMYYKNPDPPTPKEWAAALSRFKEQGLLTGGMAAQLESEYNIERNNLGRVAQLNKDAVDDLNKKLATLATMSSASKDYATLKADIDVSAKQLAGPNGSARRDASGRYISLVPFPREWVPTSIGGSMSATAPAPAPETGGWFSNLFKQGMEGAGGLAKDAGWWVLNKAIGANPSNAGSGTTPAPRQFSAGEAQDNPRYSPPVFFPPSSYQEPPNTGQPFVPGYSSPSLNLDLRQPSAQPQVYAPPPTAGVSLPMVAPQGLPMQSGAMPFLPQQLPLFQTLTSGFGTPPPVHFVPPPPATVGTGADFPGYVPTSYPTMPAWMYSPVFGQNGLLGPTGLAGQGVFGQRNMMPFVPNYISTDTMPRGMQQPYLPPR